MSRSQLRTARVVSACVLVGLAALLVPGEHEASFAYETQGDQLGLVEITLVVQDATSLVHPAMAGGDLISTFTWAVEVRSRAFVPLALRSE